MNDDLFDFKRDLGAPRVDITYQSGCIFFILVGEFSFCVFGSVALERRRLCLLNSIHHDFPYCLN